ncbi:class I SAM-dependent methyltransferase [Desertimonas flava]|uniref:class I SAM-dependent methyltransferase n=1 Tax=Desertimonas flava TaxID=2064846 RepID=UPI000E353146|nr:class I SAM-dependent methyltransferase [Desertimonas flava]
MDAENLVRDHYHRSDLEAVVLDALARVGVDATTLTVDDLSGLDQLHAGSVAATERLFGALDVHADSELLDVGSGVGGPARLAAARHGCHVTGIDLSPAFVELARALTARVGLSDSVSFEVGSATSMPFADASFDRAMLLHVGMNIERKDLVIAEVRRVLRPDGRFAVYDQMRVGDGDLTYPLPWADDERSSFVERRETYRQFLTDAGFVVERDDELLDPAAGPPPGPLTPADLFGPGFVERVLNNLAAAAAGILSPVLMVARVA